MEDAKGWLSGREASRTIAHVVTNDAPIFVSQKESMHKLDEHHNDNESNVSNHSGQNVQASVTHDEINPSDSVSNTGSKASDSRRSSAGTRSSASTTSSSRIKAEADMAALIARQRLLKDKHALEEQEEQLRKKREEFGLEEEIAASLAKVNVLRGSGGSLSVKFNSMNSYLERRQRKAKTLSADAKAFVPDTNIPILGQPNPHFLVTKPQVEILFNHHNLNLHRQDVQKSWDIKRLFQHRSHQLATLVTSSSDQSQIITFLEKQNYITALLVQQHSLSFLPKRDIQVFDGDPLQYHSFMRAFEHSIEEKADNPKDCLYFHEQYTRGQPRELVRSCQHMAHDGGYGKAKALLQEHFGNAQKTAPSTTANKDARKSRFEPCSRAKGSSFATNYRNSGKGKLNLEQTSRREVHLV